MKTILVSDVPQVMPNIDAIAEKHGWMINDAPLPHIDHICLVIKSAITEATDALQVKLNETKANLAQRVHNIALLQAEWRKDTEERDKERDAMQVKLQEAEANYELSHRTLGKYVSDAGIIMKEREQLIKVVDNMADYINSVKEFYPASYLELPHVKAKGKA